MSNDVRAYLEQHRDNENLRKWLQLISTTEGTASFQNPYLAKGGTRGRLLATGYANHPFLIGNGDEAKWYFNNKDGKRLMSTANGRYMIKQDTWKGANRALGGNLTFSPQDQDLAAMWLIYNRGAFGDILAGNNAVALRKLGPEWASLPTAPDAYKQHKYTYDRFGQAVKTVGFDPVSFGLNGQYQPLPNQKFAPQSTPNQTMNSLGGNAQTGGVTMQFAEAPKQQPHQNALDQDIKMKMPQAPNIGQPEMFNGDKFSRMFGGPRKRREFLNF